MLNELELQHFQMIFAFEIAGQWAYASFGSKFHRKVIDITCSCVASSTI